MLVSVVTKKKIKKFVAYIAIIALLFSLFLYMSKVSYPLVVELTEIQADNYVTNAMNNALKNITALSLFYSDFYTYECNKEGDIVLVKANTSNINQLMAMAQIEVQNELNKLENQKIHMHLGAFTGSSLLSDNGPVLTINLVPVGSAVSKWDSYYYAQGINQTIHRLVLRVMAQVKIIIPFKARECEVVCDFVIAEDVILGRVPDTYISGLESNAISDNLFDLIP